MMFLIHGPGGAVKLYFSVPVGMYSVFLRLFCDQKPWSKPWSKNLAKNPVKNLAKNLFKIWPKSRHADHV